MKTQNNSYISNFLKLESAGGILLVLAALMAMFFANTSLTSYYDLFLNTPLEIRIGNLEIAKPALLWINDGLMAGSFFPTGRVAKRGLSLSGLCQKKKIPIPTMRARSRSREEP